MGRNAKRAQDTYLKSMDYPNEDNMFRGKNLPQFLRQYREYYALLVGKHGRDKVLKVYTWLFKFLSSLHWGQWMVLDKVCPDLANRGLFYWCFECIYESDLLSQYEFRRVDGEERIYVVEPSEEQRERLKDFLPDGQYRLIDWYGRLLSDPRSNPDIRPEWLMLSEGETTENISENSNDYE